MKTPAPRFTNAFKIRVGKLYVSCVDLQSTLITKEVIKKYAAL